MDDPSTKPYQSSLPDVCSKYGPIFKGGTRGEKRSGVGRATALMEEEQWRPAGTEITGFHRDMSREG